MHTNCLFMILFAITCLIPLVIAKKTILCYLASWSALRPGDGKFTVLNTDVNHCTHVVYAFLGIDPETSKIKSIHSHIDTNDRGNGMNQLIRFNELKITNPEVKLLVSIGGWNEMGKKFSDIAMNPKKRKIFIDSAVELIKKYNLDGLDICWQFPGQRGGRPEDTENSILLFRELKDAFKLGGWLLTTHIIGKRYVIDKYNIEVISETVDYINFATLEYNGPWDRRTGIMAPLESNDEQNVKFSVDYIISKHVPRSKILLGLPTYGHAYVLSETPKDDKLLGLYSNSTFLSPWTNENGIIAYNEFCLELNKTPPVWKQIWDETSKTTLSYNGLKFVTLDDRKSLLLKAELVKQKSLGGVMIWSLDMDDFLGTCHDVEYPLLSAVSNYINGES